MMAHFVGLDVSVKETAVCVVDEVGEVVSEQKVPTEPDDIVMLLTSIGDIGPKCIEPFSLCNYRQRSEPWSEA